MLDTFRTEINNTIEEMVDERSDEMIINNQYQFLAITTREIFFNEESNFGIYKFLTSTKLPYALKTKLDKKISEFFSSEDVYTSTLLGVSQRLTTQTEYSVKATLERNEKYNQWQWKINSISANVPKSIEQQQRFLRAVVTENQANTLLSIYPNVIQMILDQEDIDLSCVKGIKEISFNRIREKVVNTYGMIDIVTMLLPLGVTIAMVKKLMNDEPNPELLKEKLLKNPYILTKIKGLGFKKVDALALKISPHFLKSDYRTISCITYVLEEIGDSDGHSWMTRKQMIEKVKELIPECSENFKSIINSQKENNSYNFLYVEDDVYDGDDSFQRIALKSFYNIEKYIYNKLTAVYNSPNVYGNVNVEKAIKTTNEQNGFDLTDEQIGALHNSKNKNISLLTGNAGTGKTAVTKALLNMFSGYNIAMCALSARAARRMVEVTGFNNAKTIHRLLEFQKDGFKRDEKDPLDEDIIIIDEASMISSLLFYNLLSAVKPNAKVIIIFDNGQLPPIGAGNVASDLLESKTFPITKLTKIHRQAQKSAIITDANKIRENIAPFDDYELSITRGALQDMHYAFRNDNVQLNNIAIGLYKNLLDKGLTVDDIVIIVPRKQDCINSCFEINKKIQKMVIKESDLFLKKGELTIYLGAKVIQKVNDYEKNVVNGEIGFLTKINKDFSFEITFDNTKVVAYTSSDISQIDLAYAISIHSSQGGQYKKVIVVIDKTHYILLDSCLLYTAITRAIEEGWVIAIPDAFNRCITENKNIKRQTFLSEFVKM